MVGGTYRVSQPFKGSAHRGIDYAHRVPGTSYAGADIIAAHDGVVVESRSGVGGFGCWIIIEKWYSGTRVHTVYGHMYPQDLLVSKGQTVTRGQKIARVGSNGQSSAPHLHFEVWVGGRYTGTPVDPETWLR